MAPNGPGRGCTQDISDRTRSWGILIGRIDAGVTRCPDLGRCLRRWSLLGAVLVAFSESPGDGVNSHAEAFLARPDLCE